MTIRQFLFGRKFAENEEGATAMEYGLIASLVAMALIVGARRLGRRSNRKFMCLSGSVRNERKARNC